MQDLALKNLMAECELKGRNHGVALNRFGVFEVGELDLGIA